MTTEIDQEKSVCCSGLAERRKGGENLGLGGVLVHQDRDMLRPKLVTVDEHALQRLNIVHWAFEPRWAALTIESTLTSLVIHANQHCMPFGPSNGHQPQEHREPYPPGYPASLHTPLLPQIRNHTVSSPTPLLDLPACLEELKGKGFPSLPRLEQGLPGHIRD